MSERKLSIEEANLIDLITSKLKLPFVVVSPETIYDAEEDENMILVEALSYISEALDGNEETLSKTEFTAFKEILSAYGLLLHCPLGGDETNDCEGCFYSGDYHFVDGECLKRDEPRIDDNKEWYTISFQAKMNDNDIKAMKSCFYDAMEQAMQITDCRNLNIIDNCDEEE